MLFGSPPFLCVGSPHPCRAICCKLCGQYDTKTTGVDLGFNEWCPRAKFYRSVIATSAPVGSDVSVDAEGHRLDLQEDVVGEIAHCR